MKRVLNWFSSKIFGDSDIDKVGEVNAPVGVRVRPRETVGITPGAEIGFESEVPGRIESNGPGKNVLVPSQYADASTLPEIEILDDPSPDAEASGDAGVNPYDTGCFDMSKSWGRGPRK